MTGSAHIYPNTKIELRNNLSNVNTILDSPDVSTTILSTEQFIAEMSVTLQCSYKWVLTLLICIHAIKIITQSHSESGITCLEAVLLFLNRKTNLVLINLRNQYFSKRSTLNPSWIQSPRTSFLPLYILLNLLCIYTGYLQTFTAVTHGLSSKLQSKMIQSQTTPR